MTSTLTMPAPTAAWRITSDLTIHLARLVSEFDPSDGSAGITTWCGKSSIGNVQASLDATSRRMCSQCRAAAKKAGVR